MRTLVVFCHPVADSFAAAVRNAALAGLEAGGHETRIRDLYAEGFDPLLSARDHELHFADPTTKPGILDHAADLRWCRSLVLVYPTWWAGQPAMLKGWIDRVWACGVAWELPAERDLLRPLLRNVRRITVVTTHGSSKLVNVLEGEGGKRIVTRSLRPLCSRLCRTRWIALYGIDRCSATDRTRYLDRVQHRLER